MKLVQCKKCLRYIQLGDVCVCELHTGYQRGRDLAVSEGGCIRSGMDDFANGFNDGLKDDRAPKPWDLPKTASSYRCHECGFVVGHSSSCKQGGIGG